MEFALALPVLVLFLVGLWQLGILFAANAGLKEAVGEGARYATLYPRPADDSITAKIKNKAFALNAANLTIPAFSHGTKNGVAYVDISASYRISTNFVFFAGPVVTLTSTRRAYQVS